MPYRMGRGDYYRGDYYRGGFLSGLASIGKGILKTGVGFLTGGPVGAAKGLVGHVASELSSGSSGATTPIGSVPPPAVIAPVIERDMVHVAHEQAAILKAKQSGKISASTAAALAKQSQGKQAMMVDTGRGIVLKEKRRQMRVTNVKALRRAIRRATGFAHLAMKTIKLVHPQKKGRFGGFRKKRTR